MASLLAALLAPWRDRTVRIVSRLSREEALRRIAAGGQHGRRIVTGRVTADQVRMHAGTLSRNSWRPILYARIVAVPGGCELVGTIGTHVLVKVFVALWLSTVGLITFALTALSVAGQAPWEPSMLIPLAMLGFGLTLNYAGHAMGRNDERALLEWLGRRLDSSTMDTR